MHASRPAIDPAADVALLYTTLMEAWNRGDATGFAAVFHPDGDLVGFDGTRLHGRDAIRDFHADLFRLYVNGSRLVGIVRSVRFLDEGVAVMHAEGGTVLAGQATIDPDRNSVQTMVATRRRDGWRLAAFQNTRALYYGRPELLERLTAELRELV